MIELTSYTFKSSQGPFLNINEDAIEVDLINNLFFIIDAFGGSGAGDVAAVKIKDNFKKFYNKIGGDPDSTLPFYFSPNYLIEGNALINSFYYCHQMINELNLNKTINQRMGASLAAISFSENVVNLVSVGNCLALLFRNGELKQLNCLESLENLSVDNYDKMFLTCPTNAIGLFEDMGVKLQEFKVTAGDSLLLLTDGAYNRITFKEIKYLLMKPSDSSKQKISEIFELQNQRGNLDNQSCLLLNF